MAGAAVSVARAARYTIHRIAGPSGNRATHGSTPYDDAPAPPISERTADERALAFAAPSSCNAASISRFSRTPLQPETAPHAPRISRGRPVPSASAMLDAAAVADRTAIIAALEFAAGAACGGPVHVRLAPAGSRPEGAGCCWSDVQMPQADDAMSSDAHPSKHPP